jgi:TolB-like protein/class 3 adenylate cyclase
MSNAGVRQRLAAIMAADVAGYSRLMTLDEVATVARLDTARAVFKGRVESHLGRIVDMAGDSVLAVFETAAGAVTAALDIQHELGTLDVEAPQNRRMLFRIAVHLGDVIEKPDGTVYGDGVNIAARLQELAEPGGVIVSDAVQGAVRDRVSASFEDQGEHSFKNIARPVRAFRLSTDLSARGATAPSPPPRQESARKPSVAVLPFDNISGDPTQEYFADGITEDIITALSKNRWLLVIAGHSTLALKGRPRDVRLVARELGANYVVEGSVRKAGNRVRITAQLIDGASGSHIWAERYDRDLADIFAVQDEVTGTIAARIEPELGAVERQRAERKPTQDLNAWDCYHLGLSHMYRFDLEGNRKAQRLFRDAIAFDPTFAAAHARLAYCLVLEMVYFDAMPTRETLDEALSIARTAVALDEKDAFCHLAVARVHLARREYGDAVAQCQISLDLNPSSAQAYCAMGDALSYAGRVEEAVPQFEEAIRLSPQDPWRWAFLSYEAFAQIFLRQYDKAAELARAALRVPNCQYWANAHLAAALGHLSRREEAEDAVAELLRRKPDFSCRYAEEHLFYLESRMQLEHYLEGLHKAGVPA